MARIFSGSIFSSIQRKFEDIFSSRSNTTGGLGASTSGQVWNAVNGTINVTSGAATTTTTPNIGASGSLYPISTVPMPSFDNVIKLSGTNEGSAVALWVQSSSDWWMVNVEGTQVTNTNYASSVYWSYFYTSGNVQYSYPYNYSYNYSVGTPYNYTFTDGNYTSTAGAPYTTVTTQGGTLYSSYAAYSKSPGVSYTSGTAPVTYTASSYYKVSNTYYLAGGNYTASSSTVYSSGSDTVYTTSTYYVQGATYYFVVPPGVPYSVTPTYTAAVTKSASGYTTPISYTPTGNAAATGYAFTGGYVNPTYATSFPYTYASGTTTTYSEYLKLKRSLSNTVSELSSILLSNTQTAKSILVSIIGTQITAKAYSDSNLVTQIGSDLVYTATGATVTTQYGIGISPSAYNQSAIIGTSIEISRS